MTAFSTTDLAAMRATQEDHMMDTCVHVIYSSTQDLHGQPVPSWADGDTLACGVKMDPGIEIQVGAQTVRVDVALRLPLAAYNDINQADRFRITHRFGVALTTAETYEVIGLPHRGPSGLVLNCKRVVV
ncbi:MAG: hypothetical protein KC423_29985 [Anaerolineales bacterium]|nr:hypothetical protein [Anaerolineales bacterium]